MTHNASNATANARGRVARAAARTRARAWRPGAGPAALRFWFVPSWLLRSLG